MAYIQSDSFDLQQLTSIAKMTTYVDVTIMHCNRKSFLVNDTDEVNTNITDFSLILRE